MSEMSMEANLSGIGILCEIERNTIENYSLLGYPIMVSPSLIILNYAYDFELDGYKVIRTMDITKYDVKSDSTTFLNSIYTSENIRPSMPEYLTDVKTIHDLFVALKEKEVICSVECELIDYVFQIGKVVDVQKEYIEILCFDGMCVLDEYPTKVDLCDITTVTFENRYSNVMGKNVSWPEASK